MPELISPESWIIKIRIYDQNKVKKTAAYLSIRCFLLLFIGRFGLAIGEKILITTVLNANIMLL